MRDARLWTKIALHERHARRLEHETAALTPARPAGILRRGVYPVTLFIILSIIAALLAIGAYQIIIHKYYWGPNGQPKKQEHKKDSRQK
jgi:hypothetical protein